MRQSMIYPFNENDRSATFNTLSDVTPLVSKIYIPYPANQKHPNWFMTYLPVVSSLAFYNIQPTQQTKSDWSLFLVDWQ